MRVFLYSAAIALLAMSCQPQSNNQTMKISSTDAPEFGIVIHGGAGALTPDLTTPQKQANYKAVLNKSLDAGQKILEAGGTSTEAIIAAIELMENAPVFNAGRGAVFTNEGINELDASIMDGATGMAGAVAGVRTIKNPIKAARAVMDHSPHVMLSGSGAEHFAELQKLELVPNSYFHTEQRIKSLKNAKEKELETQTGVLTDYDLKFGTVGAAALDKAGNLAAGTSTGGMTNKRYGRIGDSPVIGAGTYANNATCAISCTGHGEFFIRNVVAYDVSALMEYKEMSFKDAANEVVNKKLLSQEGRGGLIGIDKDGNVAMPFNTNSMFRGYHVQGKERFIKVFK